jgi:hypothetical protein
MDTINISAKIMEGKMLFRVNDGEWKEEIKLPSAVDHQVIMKYGSVTVVQVSFPIEFVNEENQSIN